MDIMEFDALCKTRVVFGCGKLSRLSNYKLPGRNALIVIMSDHIAEKIGALDILKNQLELSGITYSIYDGVNPNPNVETVMACAMAARESKSDFLVALGGGSVADACKAAALMATNEGYYWDFVEGKKPIVNEQLPIVTIPTSSGTGTEVLPYFVITNEEKNIKVSMPNSNLYCKNPVLSIIDPELMVSLPPDQTAYQGFDALFHCTENYIAKRANAIADFYATGAIKILREYLPRATRDGSDIEAREKIAFASYLSGLMGCMGGGCSSKHALEHGMSAHCFELPHSAGLLMICLAFYRRMIKKHACDERFIEMARMMGDTGASTPDAFLKQLEEFMIECNVNDLKMSDWGIKPEDFPKMVRTARSTMQIFFEHDRVPVSDEECLEILESSYK